MRNNWFMTIGAGRLPLAGRGFLATLEALGDSVTMRQLELDELFGIGWVAVAQELAMGGYIELEFDAGNTGADGRQKREVNRQCQML